MLRPFFRMGDCYPKLVKIGFLARENQRHLALDRELVRVNALRCYAKDRSESENQLKDLAAF